MKTIYLVRHGEATDDVEDRYGGWSDDPLTERGRETARELVGKIVRLSPKPTKIYSSPFKRAFETAEIIGDGLGIKPALVEDLKERNRYGILTSMTKTEAKTAYPQMTQQVENYMETIQGAETYDHYQFRVLRAVNKIIKETEESSLVVCHGGTFRVVMWELLKMPDYERADLNAILTIQVRNGNLVLKNHKGLVFKS